MKDSTFERLYKRPIYARFGCCASYCRRSAVSLYPALAQVFDGADNLILVEINEG